MIKKDNIKLQKNDVISKNELEKLGFKYLLLNGIYYLYAKENYRLIMTITDDGKFKVYDFYQIGI